MFDEQKQIVRTELFLMKRGLYEQMTDDEL